MVAVCTMWRARASGGLGGGMCSLCVSGQDSATRCMRTHTHAIACDGCVEASGRLSQVGIVVGGLLDSQQNGGVPLVEARDAVVVLDRLGEALHVLLLQVLDQRLARDSIGRLKQKKTK